MNKDMIIKCWTWRYVREQKDLFLLLQGSKIYEDTMANISELIIRKKSIDTAL